MTGDLEKRIEILEGVISHQQRTIDDLNDVVVAQGSELGELRRKLHALVARFIAVEEHVQPPVPADKPPHW
jgi:SlyX protein